MLYDIFYIITIFTLQGIASFGAMHLVGVNPLKMVRTGAYYEYVSGEIDHLVHPTDGWPKIYFKGVWIALKAYLKHAPVLGTIASSGAVLLTWIIVPKEYEITRIVIMCQFTFNMAQALLSLILQSTPKSANN